jgi:hypothetical protein
MKNMKLLMQNWDKHLLELAPAGNAAAQADRERRVSLHSRRQLISEASKDPALAAAEKEIEQMKKEDPELSDYYDKILQDMKGSKVDRKKNKAARKQQKQQRKQQLKQQAQQKQQAPAQTTQKPAQKTAPKSAEEGCPPGASFNGFTGEACPDAPTVKGGPGAHAQRVQQYCSETGAAFNTYTGEPCTPEATAKAKEEAPTVKGGPGAAAQQAPKAQQSNPKVQRLQKFYDRFEKDPKAAQTFVLQRIKKQMDSLK